MNKLTKVAMLAIVAASFAAVSASAQNVATSPTDLVLGFEVTNTAGQGGTTDLEVDLGAASNFSSTSSFTLSQLNVADLVGTYGSNWATNSNLVWGVAGITSQSSNTFYSTFNGSNPQNASSLSTPYGAIAQLVVGLGATAQTANSTLAATLPGTQANSWTGERTNGAGASAAANDFQYFTPAGVTEISGGPVGSLDLYSFQQVSGRSTNKPATLLGVFSLSSTGVLSWNLQATPEPSAYALGICAALLFLVLRRRQTVA